MVFCGFGEAKICNLDGVVVHEQIGGFDISVYDVMMPEMPESV